MQGQVVEVSAIVAPIFRVDILMVLLLQRETRRM